MTMYDLFDDVLDRVSNIDPEGVYQPLTDATGDELVTDADRIVVLDDEGYGFGPAGYGEQ